MSKTLAPASVDLKWVDGKAPSGTPTGTAFGVPWNQGEVDKTTPINLTAGGKAVPIQTWPMAYWPDGSLKWTGHSIAANVGLSDTLRLSTGTPAEPSSPVKVVDSGTNVTVTTGAFTAKFNKSGSTLIDSISMSGKVQVQGGTLVVNVQGAPDEPELDGARPSVAATAGRVDAVTVEQSGPVRAVIKVTGKYTGGGHADFLPFTVRFYIAAGATALRLVHFFIYDGDQTKDFIKGIGLRFTTPLTDELYNRHVRFVTADGGIWGEPIRVMSGLRRDATAAVLVPQFQGTATSNISTWPTSVTPFVSALAVWSDYTLDQLSSQRFTIAKRTNAGRNASFLDHAGFGTRASGIGYVGGATGGGVVFGIKDFWQGAPRGLDIRGAGGSTGTITLWAYSPRAPAMDMRHYDTVPHGLDLAYEDVGNPDPNPIGIGRSYEMTLQLFPATPSRATLAQLAQVHTKVPQIVASPSFYVSHKLFGGRWNLPDTSTSGAAAIEKQKSDLLDFYVMEIDQRQFYGFWNYGDVMHTYDQTRHTWRYDVGGYAWDNGELGEFFHLFNTSDLWLWMSFLRTGRADVFRIAHAMSRHLSEVDFHHIGPFAGLGSRHNVSHWGDGAKEARISGSTLKRPYYYLTTDELMGDLMDYSLQADQTIMTWDPLRKVFPPPPPQGPGRLRIGPDWTALAGNWFTKWERTNDPQWLNRIKIGMQDIGGFKFGLFTGNTTAVGWNADTAHLVDEGGEGLGSYSLVMFFGGGEFLMEAMDLITDQPAFDAAWLDFCRLYNASDADKIARYGKTFSSGGFNQIYAKLQAYAGQRLNNTAIKQAAWNFINTNTVGVWPPVTKIGGTDVVNPISEIANLATNDAAQLSLSEYAVLAIAPELAPNSLTEEQEWERSTIAGCEEATRKEDSITTAVKDKKNWRRFFMLDVQHPGYITAGNNYDRRSSANFQMLFPRRTFATRSTAYELLENPRGGMASLPLPHSSIRQQRGRIQVCGRILTVRRACYFIVLLVTSFSFYILSSGVPSTYKDVRAQERLLPQHNTTIATAERIPYLRISEHVTGRGLNNVLQETLLLSYLAYRVQRSYVFEDYIWSHLPVPYVVDDYALRPSRLPLNAFISGPTAGGPISGGPRAVSAEFWESVCPPERRRIISSIDEPKEADGIVILDWWIDKLSKVQDQCVEIDSRQVMFDYIFFGSVRVLSLFKGLAESPILKNYTWSPLVLSTIEKNSAILKPTTKLPQDTPSTSIQPGLVAIHLRRGDYVGHCKYLTRHAVGYMGFNQFPQLIDKFDPLKYQNDEDARTKQYLEHCLPNIEQIVAKLRVVRATNPQLRTVYVMTNGRRSWLDELKEALKKDGWDDLHSTLDLKLDMKEKHVSMAVDMAIAEKAEVFIGNGWSSLSSNVVMLRMAKGLDPSTIRFL